MSYPPEYDPTTSFADEESNQASGRSTVNTAKLDTELADISSSINALIENQAAVLRDDDKLKDLLVEPYALAEQTRAMMAAAGRTPRGAWTINTDYEVGDLVQRNAIAYICQTEHNSGPTFNSGFWLAISGDGSAATSAADASASASAAAASASAASTSATNAATSASSAATSATNAAASQLAAQNAADSIAALTPVNLSAFMQDLLANLNAAGVLGDLGVSAFVQTMLNDATAAEARSTLELGYLAAVTDSRFGSTDPTGVASSQTAIAAAVAHCYTEGIPLYWPDGTYLTTASVPNFHDVKHVGPGVIKRGSDLFYITPRESASNTNKLYVATTGNNANDGLSSTEPMQTIAQAGTVLSKWSDGGLTGLWRVELAAGTYTAGVSLSSLTTMDYPLEFRGPTAGHPNVPTAIVDMAGTPTGTAFEVDVGGWYIFRDIKVINATGGFGWRNTRAYLDLFNCHAENTKFPIVYQHNAFLNVSGGIYDGNNIAGSSGAEGYYGSTHNFGTTSGAATNADAPLFQRFDRGLYIGEGTYGHLDLTRVHDCTVGVFFQRTDVGCNTRQMQIWRCGTGVQAWNAAWFNNNIDFGLGTANACTVTVDQRGNSPEYDFRCLDFSAKTSRQQAAKTGISHTGTTTETQVWVPIRIRRGEVSAANADAPHTARIKLAVQGTLTGNCSVRLYCNNSTTSDFLAGVVLPSTFTSGAIEAEIVFDSKTTQRCLIEHRDQSGGGSASYGTGAQDTMADYIDVVVTAQLFAAADALNIRYAILDTTVGG